MVASVIIRFVNVTGYGNNLYLDNINIDGTFFLGTDDLELTTQFKIVPNPASHETMVQFDSPLEKTSQVELINQTGQVLMTNIIQHGATSWKINLKDVPPAIYYIRLTNNERVQIQKLVVN